MPGGRENFFEQEEADVNAGRDPEASALEVFGFESQRQEATGELYDYGDVGTPEVVIAADGQEADRPSTRGVPHPDRFELRQQWRRGGVARVRALTDMYGPDAMILGHILLEVPPIAIRIKKGNIIYRWKPLRTKETIAVQSGNGECYIEVDLAFVGLHQLNESLSQIISLWKKFPFCFIENAHMRKMIIPETPEDSMAVCLETLVMDAISGKPNTVMATLIMRWFNYKPYSQNFLFRRGWEPAISSAGASSGHDISAYLTEETSQDSSPMGSVFDALVTDVAGTSIIDLSAADAPETLLMAQPPEFRLNVSDAMDPADPTLAPTFPVVYPFNSRPFMMRVVSGIDAPHEVQNWTDGLSMGWSSFIRLPIPRTWAYEHSVVERTEQSATPTSRDRSQEQTAQPVEGERNIILIVGDSITRGYLGLSGTGASYPPERYTGSSLSRSGFEFWQMARQGARTSEMRTSLQQALSFASFRNQQDFDRVAGVIINGGLNDGADASATFRNFQQMAQMVTEKGAIAALVTTTPFVNSQLEDARETALISVCGQILQYGNNPANDRIVAINSHSVLSDIGVTGFNGQLKERFRSGSPPSYNIHPTQDGYRELAALIMKEFPWGAVESPAPAEQWMVCPSAGIQDGDTIFAYREGTSEVREIRLKYIDTWETYKRYNDSTYDSILGDVGRTESEGFGQDAGREASQRWGYLAKEHLRSLIGTGPIQITFDENPDTYGRYLGVITKNARNINLQMVRDGYAFADQTGGLPPEITPYIEAQAYASGEEIQHIPPRSPIGIHTACESGTVEYTRLPISPAEFRRAYPPADGGGYDDAQGGGGNPTGTPAGCP